MFTLLLFCSKNIFILGLMEFMGNKWCYYLCCVCDLSVICLIVLSLTMQLLIFSLRVRKVKMKIYL